MLRLLLKFVILSLLLTGCGPENDTRQEGLAHEVTGVENSPAAAAAQSDMVQWLQPAIPDLPLRSEEEKQLGMEHGREPPPAELLQPGLDPDLTPFTPRPELNLSGTVRGGASDVLPGVVNLWIERFSQYYPAVNIEIGRPYAGSLGMLEVIDGTYDFVFVSRELKPTDISAFSDKYGYDPLTVPVAGGSYRHYGFLDAIGFFVNISNPMDSISFAQIDAIFSSTRHRGGASITTWGQLGLGGEWKDLPVHPYGVEPWNGFEEFVRQRVLSKGELRGEWREDVRFSHTAFPVSEQVANDPLAIGYTGLAYITRGVKMLPLAVDENSGRYIAPSYENVADASYPLGRLIYFNSNKDPEAGLNPILDEFLRFILSKQGQQAVLDHAIFLPLRKEQLDQSIEVLDQHEFP